mmetsp:Transcript_13439/g.27135  ORF Transcript_13439/g.27135 Transcript_13439/m.27135 type:complete len:80 (-) Transcript_13439:176-415(-)
MGLTVQESIVPRLIVRVFVDIPSRLRSHTKTATRSKTRFIAFFEYGDSFLFSFRIVTPNQKKNGKGLTNNTSPPRGYFC